LAGYKHFSLERHQRRVLIADPMEEASDVSGSPSVVSNGQGSVKKRFVRQRTQKGDGIQEIRFSNPVRSRDASERPKLDIHVN
jgi:hypothetical protein